MAMAVELDLPVIIHSRDADDDMILVLDKYALPTEKEKVLFIALPRDQSLLRKR